MLFKGILFDKDGTLIDVDGTWVPYYRDVLMREFSIGAEKAERMMTLGGYDIVSGKIMGGSIMAGGTTRQLVDIWWPELSADQRTDKASVLDHGSAELALQHLKPLMPLQPQLQILRDASFKLGIATNDSMPSTVKHMAALEITHFFDAVLTADTVSKAKPSGEMVKTFAMKTGLQSRDVIMVGDNTHDIEEARNGGAGLAVGVLTGNCDAKTLGAVADVVLPSIEALPALLRDRGHVL